MGCFLAPATEAIVTTAVTKVIEKSENKKRTEALANGITINEFNKEGFSKKLKRLNYLLWGGSGLLAFEHLWHGEIQPFFPFLTAASNSADFSVMMHEIATTGVTMAAVVTAVWGVLTYVETKLEAKDRKEAKGILTK